MIEAVVDYIDDPSNPPPPALSLAWDVERWGALPIGGGLYDQDYALLRQMTVLNNVYKSVSRLRSMDGAQIHQLTHGERVIIGMLRDEGLL